MHSDDERRPAQRSPNLRYHLRSTVTAAFLAVAPPAAFAECEQRIEEVASRLPDLTQVSIQEAKQRTGLAEEQIEAVLATLDAARLANAAGETEGCMTMAQVAEDLLAKGKQ